MIMSSSRSSRNLAGDDGPLRRLRLLAAEAAAHAPHLDRHGVARPVERVGDQVLHLARMLGRAMDEHVPILHGDGERDLALEIEMILSADIDPAAEAMACRLERARRIAAAHFIGVEHEAPLRQCVCGRQDRREVLVLDGGQLRRHPGGVDGLGRHGEQHLAGELDLVGREDRVVMLADRADIVDAWYVGRRQNQHHARRRAYAP
jgi:hypothetical protein